MVSPEASDNTGLDIHTSLSSSPSIDTITSNAPSVAGIVAPLNEKPSTVVAEDDTASKSSLAVPSASTPVTPAPVISNWNPPTSCSEL